MASRRVERIPANTSIGVARSHASATCADAVAGVRQGTASAATRIAVGRMLLGISDKALFDCLETLSRRVMPGSGSRLQIEGNEIRAAGRLCLPVEDGDAHR